MLQAREFRVRSAPVHVAGQDFTVMVLSDISGDKRREALEHTFFHDVLNTLGGLLGWCNLLQEVGHHQTRRIASRIAHLGLRLKDEIEDHRRLSDAEAGVLAVARTETPVGQILLSIRTLFEAHEAIRGRRLQIDDPAASKKTILTDRPLLSRVLANMVKNALEAVAEGDAVRLWFTREAGAAIFCVHNPGVIPAAIAHAHFSALIQHQDPARPRHWRLQHETDRRALPWRTSRIYERRGLRDDLLHPPAGGGENAGMWNAE